MTFYHGPRVIELFASGAPLPVPSWPDTQAPTILTPLTGAIEENQNYAIILAATEAVAFTILPGVDGAAFTLDDDMLTLPAQDFEAGKIIFTCNLRAIDAAGNQTDFIHRVFIGDIDDAPLYTHRLIQFDSNTIYAVVGHAPSGGAIAHKFTRNSGGSAGTDLGGSWPAWRHTGTVLCAVGATAAQITTNFGTAALLISNDIGAQDYAILNTAQNKYGLSYHGIGSGSVTQSWTVDGVAFDGSQEMAGFSIALAKTETAIWDNGDTATVVMTLSIGDDGVLDYAIPSLSAPFASGQSYVGMALLSGNAVESVHGNGTTRYAAPANQTVGLIFPAGTTDIMLRDPTTGYTVRTITNGPSKAGFSRMEQRPLAGRNKNYPRYSGTLGTITNITWSTSFGVTPPGATAYNANLVTNGSFASDLSGWTNPVGSNAAFAYASGKARGTRSANATKMQQAVTLEVARYMVQMDVSANYATSSAVVGVGLNVNGSLNSPAAPVKFSASEAGSQAIVFDGTAVPHYVLPNQEAGVAGPVVDFDQISLIKLKVVA